MLVAQREEELRLIKEEALAQKQLKEAQAAELEAARQEEQAQSAEEIRRSKERADAIRA